MEFGTEIRDLLVACYEQHANEAFSPHHQGYYDIS